MIALKHTVIRKVNGDVHISFAKNNTMHDFYIPEEEFKQMVEEWYSPRTL